MAETVTLTEQQLKAVSMLAAGMKQGEVAKTLSKTRVTIHRWQKQDDFAAALAAEIERRRLQTEQELRSATDAQIRQDVADLREDLAEYHKAVINVQKQRLSRGKVIMDKAFRRLQDLPDEALSEKSLASLFMAGDRLFEKGLESWAEALAVDDIMRRLDNGQE